MLQNLKAASLKLVQLCGSYLYGRLSRDVQAGVFHCAVDGGCRLLLRPCVLLVPLLPLLLITRVSLRPIRVFRVLATPAEPCANVLDEKDFLLEANMVMQCDASTRPRLPQKRLMQRCAKQGTPYAALTTVSCCKNLGIPAYPPVQACFTKQLF